MKKTNEELYQKACEYYYKNKEHLRGDYESLLEPTQKQLNIFAKLVVMLHTAHRIKAEKYCYNSHDASRNVIKELYDALKFTLTCRHLFIVIDFVGVDLLDFSQKTIAKIAKSVLAD